MSFEHLKPGDHFTRNLCGRLMVMQVDAIRGSRIVAHAADFPAANGYEFDRATGIEIDDELGWGLTTGRTGSFIVGRKDVQ